VCSFATLENTTDKSTIRLQPENGKQHAAITQMERGTMADIPRTSIAAEMYTVTGPRRRDQRCYDSERPGPGRELFPEIELQITVATVAGSCLSLDRGLSSLFESTRAESIQPELDSD
jgi:hypothetical protein